MYWNSVNTTQILSPGLPLGLHRKHRKGRDILFLQPVGKNLGSFLASVNHGSQRVGLT